MNTKEQKVALNSLKRNESPALYPYVPSTKDVNSQVLKHFAYLHCNFREYSNNVTTCEEFKKEKCYKKFTRKCKIIGYKLIMDGLIKRSCVLAWGINNTKFTFGNNPYLALVNSDEYDYINIFAVLSTFVIIQVFAIFYRKMEKFYDGHLTSCADYSCIVHGLPSNQDKPEWKVWEKMQETLKEHDYDLEQQVFIFKSERWEKINSKVQKAQDKIGEYLYKTRMNLQEADQKDLKKLLKKYFKKKNELNTYEDAQFKHNCTEDFQGRIIVSFRTEQQRNKFHEAYKQEGF